MEVLGLPLQKPFVLFPAGQILHYRSALNLALADLPLFVQLNLFTVLQGCPHITCHRRCNLLRDHSHHPTHGSLQILSVLGHVLYRLVFPQLLWDFLLELY